MNIERVLDALHIDYHESGENARALCPMHERITGKADRNPSWFIHMETGQHICFSCGYKGNLVQLVCDINEFYTTIWGTDTAEYDYAAGNSWLASAIEVTVEDLKESFKKIPEYMTPPPKPLPMSESRMALFVDPTAEVLERRNVTAEAAEHYGVRWDKTHGLWVLPIREPETNLLWGWQEKGEFDRTFRNRPAGVTKSKTLFGINQQQEDVVIIVESPLDCLRLRSAGITGAVATFGAIVSDQQAKLLTYSSKIIAAFDNPNIDPAGKKASDHMREISRKLGLNLFFFNYGDSGKKDPGDMTDEELHWGIENAKLGILGEQAYVYGAA